MQRVRIGLIVFAGAVLVLSGAFMGWIALSSMAYQPPTEYRSSAQLADLAFMWIGYRAARAGVGVVRLDAGEWRSAVLTGSLAAVLSLVVLVGALGSRQAGTVRMLLALSAVGAAVLTVVVLATSREYLAPRDDGRL